MKFNRNRTIEIFSAIFLVALLFVVMVPKFIKAQQHTYVSRALREMDAIARAMQAYNLDEARDAHGYRLQKAMINYNTSVIPTATHHYLYPFDTDWKLMPDESFLHLPYRRLRTAAPLAPIFNADAEPPLEGKEGKYYGTYYVSSNPAIDIDQLLIPISSIEQSWHTKLFRNKRKSSAFIGYCRGPYFELAAPTQSNSQEIIKDNYFIVTQGDVLKKIWGAVSYFIESVEYNPTNGVESHGYVVFRSAAPATESISDYFPGLKIEETVPPYGD